MNLRLLTDWFNIQFLHLSCDFLYCLTWNLNLSFIKIFILRITMRIFLLDLFWDFYISLLKFLLVFIFKYSSSDKLSVFGHLFYNNILCLKECEIFIVIYESKNTIHDLPIIMHGGIGIDLENLVIEVNLNTLLFKFPF